MKTMKIVFMLFFVLLALNAPMLYADGGPSATLLCPWCAGGWGVGDEKDLPSVSSEQAASVINRYIIKQGNPNLRLGQMTDKGTYFEIEIITKEGSLVDKIMLDKQSGLYKSIY